MSLRYFIIPALLTFGLLNAGGFRLSEVGTSDIGVANAGSAAVGRDAGTVYFNPAAMILFDRDQLVLGAQTLFIDVRFKGSSESLFNGPDGGQAGFILPALGVYCVHSVNRQFKWGVAINSPYGGIFNYGQPWKGRYIVQRIFMPTFAINPAFACRVTPCFSIGGGFTVQYGILDEAFALNPIVFGGTPVIDPDGRLKLGMDSFAFGYNLGFLYQLGCHTRLGLSYRSRLRHKFAGRQTITGPVHITLGVDTEVKMADFLIFSLYHQLTNELAILANIGWEHWKIFNRTTLTSDNGGSFTIPRDWRDTWHIALGIEFRLCEPLLLQAGFSYDSSPTSAPKRTPDLPMDHQFRFGTGVLYDVNSCERLGLAVEYLYGGRAAIDLKRDGTNLTLLKGNYNSNNLLFVNLTYNRKF